MKISLFALSFVIVILFCSLTLGKRSLVIHKTKGKIANFERYANVLGILIALAVLSSILLYSGCGMTSRANIPPNRTPPPDTTPPTVTSFSPAAGATDAIVDRNVIVTFSEAMDPATVNISTIELRDPSNALVPAIVFYDASFFTALLNPVVDLAPRVTYTARVRGGSTAPRVKDLAGNAASFTGIHSGSPRRPQRDH